MMTNLLKRTALQMLICLFSFVHMNGQANDKFNGLVMKPDWQQYRLLSESPIAVDFPKFPTLTYERNDCGSFERYIYAAYAEDVVFTAVVTKGVKSNSTAFCRKFAKFSKQTIENRIAQLIDQKKLKREELIGADSDRVLRLKGDNYKINIIDDMENDRFVELWITADPRRKFDEEKFFRSFTYGSKSTSIDPKGGLVSTAGDDIIQPFDIANWIETQPEKLTSKFYIVHRPRPSYTDAARQNNIQGVVRLKVRLLANGSVGEITPERTLRFGLTEHAIAAARRIVFLPEKVNGKNEDKVVTMEYNFTIY